MAQCLIISARGKRGHERQAIAIAQRLALSYSVSIAQEFPIRTHIPPECLCLIAAGRQSLAPARSVARRDGVRPFVLALQPVLWRPGDFDAIWSPLHDRRWFDRLLPPRIETLTAPSAVTAADRASGAALLGPRLRRRPGGVVGVIVGGATADAPFSEADAARLADAVACLAHRHDVTLALTTSRRTGEAQTRLLEERLGGDGHVIVNADAPDSALIYAGLLELADAFVVTADSVAMLSDAATTGKPIHAWRIGRGKRRFERFHNGLITYGAMRWFDGDLPSWAYAPLDAAADVANVLRPRLGLLHAAAQYK